MIRRVVVAALVAAGVLGSALVGGTEDRAAHVVLPAPVVGVLADGRTLVVDVATDPSADITADMLVDCLKARGAYGDPTDGREALYVDVAQYGYCAP